MKVRLPLFFAVTNLCLLLSACASSSRIVAHFSPEKTDLHFPGFQQIEVVDESEIFWLNNTAKAYIRQHAEQVKSSKDKALVLINELFTPAQLSLDYVHGANTTAQATFDSGKANCLSLTILAYAMAKEAGLEATFFEVFQQESWSQLGDFDLANGHVNLKISAIPKNRVLQGIPVTRKTYTVDFFPTTRKGRYKTREIDKVAIISYFYSNLAAQAIVDGDQLRAYAYIRKSMLAWPNDSSTWNNFAIILKRQNLQQEAIEAYQQAIKLRSDNLTAWENMAALLAQAGDIDRAQTIRKRLEKQRKENPNYYLRLGNRYLLTKQLHKAETSFKKSLELDNQNHFAWFGLARVQGLRGDKAGVLKNLQHARRYGRRDGFAARYASKIDAIRD